MRHAGIQGLYRRRRHGCTVRDPDAQPSADLVNRQFTVDAPNRLWITDITEHPTAEGKVYCAAVMDAYSRLIVGWSIAEHMRTELVTRCARHGHHSPAARETHHRRHARFYTPTTVHNTRRGRSGNAYRRPNLLASMGTVGDCYDNAMMESFWGTMQLELLDSRIWRTRDELANAIFEWIECWYNPKWRHSSIGMHSPITFEDPPHRARPRSLTPHRRCPAFGGKLIGQ